jgi:hypothetical protein
MIIPGMVSFTLSLHHCIQYRNVSILLRTQLLVYFNITLQKYCRSVTFGTDPDRRIRTSANPDPTPDPGISVSDLQDDNEKLFCF